MIQLRHVGIAIIGDEDLVSGMRLAGVSHYFTIEDNQNTGEDVRKALTGLLSEPNVGIVAIQEEFMKYVEDLMARIEQEKRAGPAIIGIPSKYGPEYRDVAKYYKEYIRKFIGFNVEI